MSIHILVPKLILLRGPTFKKKYLEGGGRELEEKRSQVRTGNE